MCSRSDLGSYKPKRSQDYLHQIKKCLSIIVAQYTHRAPTGTRDICGWYLPILWEGYWNLHICGYTGTMSSFYERQVQLELGNLTINAWRFWFSSSMDVSEWRPCGDYRILHFLAIPKKHMIAHLYNTASDKSLPPDTSRVWGHLKDGRHPLLGLFEFLIMTLGFKCFKGTLVELSQD